MRAVPDESNICVETLPLVSVLMPLRFVPSVPPTRLALVGAAEPVVPPELSMTSRRRDAPDVVDVMALPEPSRRLVFAVPLETIIPSAMSACNVDSNASMASRLTLIVDVAPVTADSRR